MSMIDNGALNRPDLPNPSRKSSYHEVDEELKAIDEITEKAFACYSADRLDMLRQAKALTTIATLKAGSDYPEGERKFAEVKNIARIMAGVLEPRDIMRFNKACREGKAQELAKLLTELRSDKRYGQKIGERIDRESFEGKIRKISTIRPWMLATFSRLQEANKTINFLKEEALAMGFSDKK